MAWLETKPAVDVIISDCKLGRGRRDADVVILAVVEVESLQLVEATQLWGKLELLTWFAMTTPVKLELEESGEL